MLQYVIMCVFPRSQSKWPPCYVKLPFSFLCSFKILRSTVSERGRAAVLFVGNLLTSNLLHIIREKSLQLPSNNRYDQMCVLMNIFESLGWSPNCWESGGPCSSPLLCTVNNEMVTWKTDTGTENEAGNDNELKTLTFELPPIALKIWPRIAGLLHHQSFLFMMSLKMLVFIMSPHVCFYYVTKWGRCCSVFNGQAAHPVIPCCGCPHQITIPNNNNLSFKSQSQIIIIFLSNHNPK